MSSNLTIIRKPLVTEKVHKLQEKLNKYVFEVDPDAGKIQIKSAVETRFKVHVTSVRTITLPGKVKRLGRFSGRRPDRKKAIVTLAKDEKIELFEGA
ncbi:MAG: 50S ribosomal protein L23 [Calditrichaeota bacterium]|nr:50S ribosomal protein L23 [Calditrichota bacterium]